jgi:hypothetical protein
MNQRDPQSNGAKAFDAIQLDLDTDSEGEI